MELVDPSTVADKDSHRQIVAGLQKSHMVKGSAIWVTPMPVVLLMDAQDNVIAGLVYQPHLRVGNGWVRHAWRPYRGKVDDGKYVLSSRMALDYVVAPELEEAVASAFPWWREIKYGF